MRHPFHDPGLSAKQIKKLVRQLGPIMSLSERQVLALVPVQTSVRSTGCPNCANRSSARDGFIWSVDAPDRIACRFCGHVYPSQRYPMDHTETVRNPLGEQVTVRFHVSDEGERCYFEGVIWHYRRLWLIDQAHALAKVYHVTRQPQYARRAALIIDRFAQVYPGYCVVTRKHQPGRGPLVRYTSHPKTHGYGYRWSWYSTEVPRTLPLAYDLIYACPELDKLSKELGTDVRSRIAGFFREAVEYAKSFLEKEKYRQGNLAGYGVMGIVRIGRCLDEPTYIHWAYAWVRDMLDQRFWFDGMWPEAPSYHRQTVQQIDQILEALTGYSDPPGYHSADGSRFDNLDPAKALPFLSTVRPAPAAMAFPDG
ncbi:MAG: hypothetical protein IID40_03450, partial [Planctomycetes bacterium]|nr:hypothetical protein [Planctomycetota bacterium]